MASSYLLARWRGLSATHALQAFHLARQGGVILAAILLAHSGLSRADIGRYELLQYLGALLSMAWVSGLVQGLLSQYPRLAPERQAVFLYNAALAFGGGAALVGLVLWLAPPALLQLLVGVDALPYLGWFGLYLLGNLPANLQENYYLLHQRPHAILWYGTLSALGFVAAVCLPPWLGLGLGVSMRALALLGLLKLGWLVVFLGRHARLTLDLSLLHNWWRLSWPLVTYALLALLNQYVDSWWVTQLYPADEQTFAIYRYGARELPLATALSAGLAAAFLPRLSANLNEGLAALRVQSKQLFHLFFPAALALLLGSPWWFPAVFSRAFAESVLIFDLYMLIGISRMVFSLTVLIALSDNRVAIAAAVVSLVAHTILSGLLGVWWGLPGIALGTVLAFSLEKALLALYLYRRHGIGPGRYTHLPWLASYSLALLLAMAVVWVGLN